MQILKIEDIIKIFRGGLCFLGQNKSYVDSLNVFPVPDGDTGTNMNLTMQSAVKEMESVEDPTLETLCAAISRGALKGARGNSGVILSQILKGVAVRLSNEKQVTTSAFAKGLKNGSNVAYDVVTHPKEGTILTVIRLMSDYAVKIASRKKEFEEFLTLILKKGEEVLDTTPELLPVLKKAGVVDAGGKGLLIILKGMLNALTGVEMEPLVPETAEEVKAVPPQSVFEADIHDLENIKFAYCTEYFIINLHKKTTISDIDKLRDRLNTIGDCVIVVGDLQLVKVHVHTNNPDKALEYALQLGELGKLKVENMLEQNREFQKLKKKDPKKKMGLVSICTGDGLNAIFKDLMADQIIEGGQTMNPSVADIVTAVNKVDAETVFILPNNGNIILTAEQAKELSTPNLVVIATKNIPAGIAAAMNFNPEFSIEENTRCMQKAANEVRSGQVTHAVRDTEMDGFQLEVGDIIGIYGSIVAKGKSVDEVTLDTARAMTDDSTSVISLFCGEDVTEEEAEALAEKMRGEFDFYDVLVYRGGQQHYYYYLSVE